MPAAGIRSKAKSEGRLTYFTGKPCPRGHQAGRYTGSGCCVECKRIDSSSAGGAFRKRKWAASNSERRREVSLAWYRRNAEAQKAKARARNATDPAWREKRRLARLANAPAFKVYYRQWVAENRDVVRAHLRNNKAMRRAAVGKHTAADIRALFVEQRGRCKYCAADLIVTGYHVDHVVALARGGTNWPDNLCLACPPCNVRKQATPAHIFQQRIAAAAA